MSVQGQYKRIFRAAYNYLERADKELYCAEAEALSSVWETLSAEAADLIEQDDSAFAVDMLTAINDELYRCYFEQAEGGEC